VELRRAPGEGGAAQRWIDDNLPKCPLCRTETLWETGVEADQEALGRWVFRCPNCKAVLSTIPPTTVGAVAGAMPVVKTPLEELLRVESVGKKEDEDFVGEEFPLAELQVWASEDEG
jgi:hypothetical protein